MQKRIPETLLTYNLTWNDVYYILNATPTPDEKNRVWEAVKAHADPLHNQDRDSPVADEAVPQLDPRRDAPAGESRNRRLNQMTTCLQKESRKIPYPCQL